MSTTGAEFLVDAIPLAPPRVSLLTSVEVVTDADEHFGNGIVWQSEPCLAPDSCTDGTWWACEGTIPAGPEDAWPEMVGQSAVAVNTTKDPADLYATDTDDPVDQERRAYDIWVGLNCGSQPARGDELHARTLRALEAYQSFLIERELWSGCVARAAGFEGNWPYGTFDAPTTESLGNDHGFVTAFGELEQWLARRVAGQTGVIHAQARLVSDWVSAGLVIPEPNGRRLRSALGTIVVPGGGYPGTYGLWDDDSEGGTVRNQFAYATGMVRVYLGPVSRLLGDDGASAEHDISLNTTTVRLERSVVTMFDPCTVARIGVDRYLAVGNSD